MTYDGRKKVEQGIQTRKYILLSRLIEKEDIMKKVDFLKKLASIKSRVYEKSRVYLKKGWLFAKVDFA